MSTTGQVAADATGGTTRPSLSVTRSENTAQRKRPARRENQRYVSTFWVRTFALARLGATGADSTRWHRVERTYTRLSAQQLVSDITNSHRRPSGKVRVRGMLPGERWAAKAESCDVGASADYMVYIRYLGAAEGE